MVFYADLHIHSKYSLATGKSADLENFHLWAVKKGISLIGTGDCAHPAWIKEMKGKLKETGNGFYKLKKPPKCGFDAPNPEGTLFCPSVELSSIYKWEGKTKKIHTLFLFQSLDQASQFSKQIEPYGKIGSDGRPILRLGPRELLETALTIASETICIPAHIWTPWFSLLGEKSGFDSVEDCFRDLSEHVCALETGLSSDPAMNRTISSLDKYSLVSFSDAHSPAKIGREATAFSCKPDFCSLKKAIKTGSGLEATVEFFPEEGKYHLDGHLKCGFSRNPLLEGDKNRACPVCGKPLTPGVCGRIGSLADRPLSQIMPDKPYYSITPLPQIISEITGKGTGTKGVALLYEELLKKLGNEYSILLNTDPEDAEKALPRLGEALLRMRRGEVYKDPGYDGRFGKINVLP